MEEEEERKELEAMIHRLGYYADVLRVKRDSTTDEEEKSLYDVAADEIASAIETILEILKK